MHVLPGDIERASMSIIQGELDRRGVALLEDEAPVVRRVIHATADFDFADNLRFTPGAAGKGTAALKRGVPIVTDANMARAGVSRPALEQLGGSVHCFMAEPEIAETARREGTTRAAAAMKKAARDYPQAIFAVGNAPTALLELAVQIEAGLRPALVIAVPVGFVNVVESKERVWEVCERYQVPAIAAMGRKGGSTVAAAICNALLYIATDRKIQEEIR